MTQNDEMKYEYCSGGWGIFARAVGLNILLLRATGTAGPSCTVVSRRVCHRIWCGDGDKMGPVPILHAVTGVKRGRRCDTAIFHHGKVLWGPTVYGTAVYGNIDRWAIQSRPAST